MKDIIFTHGHLSVIFERKGENKERKKSWTFDACCAGEHIGSNMQRNTLSWSDDCNSVLQYISLQYFNFTEWWKVDQVVCKKLPLHMWDV